MDLLMIFPLEIGIILWQAFLFVLGLIFLYILFKIVKKVSKW